MTFAEIASRAIARTLTIPQDLCYFIKSSPPRKLSARVRFLGFFFYFFLLFFLFFFFLFFLRCHTGAMVHAGGPASLISAV